MIIKVTNEDQNSLITVGKYSLHYEVGKVTESLPDTLGIFCYKGEYMLDILYFLPEDAKFYEVEGIREPLKEIEMCENYPTEQILDKFYLEGIKEPLEKAKIPKSFIVFNAVKLIREFSFDDILKGITLL